MTIKYRVWDKRDNRMYDWEQIKDLFSFDEMEHDDLVWQQYTGLKDKNGQEIYEGDVVDTFDGKGKIIYESTIGSFAIEYSIYKIALPQYLAQINAEIKVIGNIYENPELLEEVIA